MTPSWSQGCFFIGVQKALNFWDKCSKMGVVLWDTLELDNGFDIFGILMRLATNPPCMIWGSMQHPSRVIQPSKWPKSQNCPILCKKWRKYACKYAFTCIFPVSLQNKRRCITKGGALQKAMYYKRRSVPMVLGVNP